MTKDDRTIPDAPADTAAADVARVTRPNDTRPLGTLVPDKLAVAESQRSPEAQRSGPPAPASPQDEEPKKKFEPWRFAAHTMPPELRKELSEMTLPNADPARLYWARMMEESDTPAETPASQDGSLVPVDQPISDDRNSRNETTQRLGRRRRKGVQSRVGIAIVVLGATVVLGTVALMRSGERAKKTSPAAAPAAAPTRERTLPGAGIPKHPGQTNLSGAPIGRASGAPVSALKPEPEAPPAPSTQIDKRATDPKQTTTIPARSSVAASREPTVRQGTPPSTPEDVFDAPLVRRPKANKNPNE